MITTFRPPWLSRRRSVTTYYSAAGMLVRCQILPGTEWFDRPGGEREAPTPDVDLLPGSGRQVRVSDEGKRRPRTRCDDLDPTNRRID